MSRMLYQFLNWQCPREDLNLHCPPPQGGASFQLRYADLVPELGFEPRYTPSKGGVLPLDDSGLS